MLTYPPMDEAFVPVGDRSWRSPWWGRELRFSTHSKPAFGRRRHRVRRGIAEQTGLCPCCLAAGGSRATDIGRFARGPACGLHCRWPSRIFDRNRSCT